MTDRFHELHQESAAALLDACPVGILLLDSDGKIAWANPAAGRMLGTGAAPLEGRGARRLLAEAFGVDPDLMLDPESGSATPAGGEPPRFHCPRSGAWVEPRLDASRVDTGFTALYLSDVSRRVEHLRERERLLRAIIEASVDLLLILDDDGRLLHCSRAAEHYLGCSAQQALGHRFGRWIHPDEEERVLEELLDPEAPSRGWDYQFRLRPARGGEGDGFRGDGHREQEARSADTAEATYRALECRVMDLREKGRIPGRLVVARDIGKRRNAEAAVRSSEVRYRRLFEQSRDVVSISDVDGRLLDMNRAGLDLLGYSSKEEVLSLDIAREIYVNREERYRILAAVNERGFTDFETLFRNRHGDERLVSGTLVNMKDEHGESAGLLGILRDITDQRRIEDQLRQSQKMEAVGRLASGIAHDFNNMLTAIHGYCDLLIEEASGGPLSAYAREVAAASARAADLTSKLLTLGRKQALVQKVVSINQLVRGLESLLRRLIGEDVELWIELARDAGQVRIDPGQMEQAILNLAVNARDAMPRGGRLELCTRRLSLDTSAADRMLDIAAGDYVELALRDHGEGMSERVREHIFEPFFTTKEEGKGTGLGLAMVYATIRQYEGHIEVESTPGEGTTFQLLLPRVEEAAEVAAPREPNAEGRGAERLLVVEDDPPLAKLLREQLERLGSRVSLAENGERALALADELGHRFDLLLCDVILPSSSGPELAARLLESRPDLPVLFISGYAGPFLERHGFRKADHEVLQKPFSTRTLATRLRSLLDRRLRSGSPESRPLS
ncbi:MAG: PAS domain S-box protein [Holophagales bacterium]|nr:PAS domain S-box protein [Holophagales bacterium]